MPESYQVMANVDTVAQSSSMEAQTE